MNAHCVEPASALIGANPMWRGPREYFSNLLGSDIPVPRMDNSWMRRASANDIPLLVSLMDEFYAEGGYKLDRERAAGAFNSLLADERLGSVWIIQQDQRDVGHLVLTYRFAMEYGGLAVCLDDLYVRPAARNKGLGTSALFQVRDFCQTVGFRAMTVEVGHKNGAAQAVYRHAGFSEAVDRQVLALALADPAHFN